MVDPALLRDRVLVGRYRLDERLGAGGMGSIWRAQHLVLAAPVAVKLIDREAIPDDEMLGRFMREAQSAATLRSPHVVQIIDYGVDEQLPFIVMELLDGENLAERLRRMGRLPSADTARIVTHIGRAVGRAHDAGIVHRDLKPENVFLIRNEDEEIAKVLDFGVAKVPTAALGGELGTRTRTGSILGTPYYMSPEQAQGNKAVDHRSDLWSLGVIAFECLTGRRPFYSDGLGDLVLQICIRDIPIPSEMGSVPPGFDAWFARAVARDPETRFQSARDLTDSLREVLGGEARELHFTSPEVGAASPVDEAPNSRPRTRVDSRTPASRARFAPPDASSEVRSTVSRLPADQHAATVAATSDAPSSARGAGPRSERGDNAVIAALLASAEADPPPRRSSAALVFWVALTALAIGLGVGLLFVMHHEVRLRPLPKAVPPARDVERTPVRAKLPEHVSGAHDDLPGTLAASAKPAAGPRLVAPATPKALAATPEAPSAAAPDAGWVKPAWAIPDDEPHRAHDEDARDAGK